MLILSTERGVFDVMKGSDLLLRDEKNLNLQDGADFGDELRL